MKPKGLMVVGLVALVAMSTASTAAASGGRVVVGCTRFVEGQPLLLNRKAHPRDCGNPHLGGAASGILRVRWSHWGAPVASGRGQLLDGLGFRYPARFWAFGLSRRDGLAFYSRMHGISQGRSRGGAWRPGINKVVRVTPAGLTRASAVEATGGLIRTPRLRPNGLLKAGSSLIQSSADDANTRTVTAQPTPAIRHVKAPVARVSTAATPGHGYTWRNSIYDRPATLWWTGDGSGGYTALRWTRFLRGGEPVAIARGGVYLRLCWGGDQNPSVCNGSQIKWFTVGRVTLTFAGVNNHDRWEAVKIRTRIGWRWRSLIGRRRDAHVFKPNGTIYSFLAGKAPAGLPPFFPCGSVPEWAFNEYLAGRWPYPYVHTNPETGACRGVR